MVVRLGTGVWTRGRALVSCESSETIGIFKRLLAIWALNFELRIGVRMAQARESCCDGDKNHLKPAESAVASRDGLGGMSRPEWVVGGKRSKAPTNTSERMSRSAAMSIGWAS